MPRWRVVMLFKDMHVARALNWALQPFQILSTSQELIIAQRNIHGSMNISPSSACRTSIKEGLAPGVVKDVDFYDHRRVRAHRDLLHMSARYCILASYWLPKFKSSPTWRPTPLNMLYTISPRDRLFMALHSRS